MSTGTFYIDVPPFPGGEPRFMQELKTYDPRKAHWQNDKDIPADSLSLAGKWELVKNFPDPENLLETAYSALERFAGQNVVAADERKVEITTVQDKTLAEEEYVITVSPEGITLTAADTEGVRRAVYTLIDMCRSAAVPALEYQRINRKPWLKNRISRCFFGPIKRAPFFRDELTDDIDYYPEAYLDRMASEGINGIWLTIVWKELGETSFFPVDPLREKRIEKLKKTVEKCRRYGIKVWVFCIEPASWNSASLPPFEDMQGEVLPRSITFPFCIASENSKRYIRETVGSIFRDTPNLGGMMLISLGERPTSCLSYVDFGGLEAPPCSKMCGMSNSKILDTVLSSIRQGITDAGSDAQILSWLYNPRANQIPEWWFTMPQEVESDKILAFNFESGCSKMQDGRVCSGGDYWLSCIGPSDRFGRIAAAAQGNCQLAAKLQVGCSHELATVPFMPVPGNLYEKYRAMKRLGVSSVIQCWYFGNYPGLMNRAAGMLAFEDFQNGKLDFLNRLALPDWGSVYASKVAEMWQEFGKAYDNYPLDIQFQYYGPMHDGVVWPLHLKQNMKPLPRSWKPDTAPAGDAIGECLNTFQLTNAVTLTKTLAKLWNNAVAILPELREKYADDPARLRDCDLYEALNLLFNSGARILAFYDLRRRLFTSPIDFRTLLAEMQKIVEAEKNASLRMTELCKDDARLGYHSEAEVFKFYPEKLLWRVQELEKLTPLFAELQAADEKTAKALLAWNGAEYHTATRYKADTFAWECSVKDLDLEIAVDIAPPPSEKATRDEQYVFIMDSNGAAFPLEFGIHDDGTPYGFNNKCQGVVVETVADGKKVVRVSLNKINYEKEIFIGFLRYWFDENGKQHFDTFPQGAANFESRLNFGGLFSSDKMVKLVLN